MGFELHVADGPSIAIRAKKRHGAPVTINLETLLGTAPGERNKWLKQTTDQDVTGAALATLKSAATVEDLQAALKNKIHVEVTPVAVRAGAMIFQPSPERRRSGSHYTPRALTKPIVEAALEPVLKELGLDPRPGQILALKICDPAMGSGAFLVEACRQLGATLVEAWRRHGDRPALAEDEDELLLAQRIVAQRCLYGVDKNRMAVDLAKLSLWLATLAKDHAFTFLNHSLKHGDSLVGLTPRRIASVDWVDEKPLLFLEKEMRGRIASATGERTKILEARDDTPYDVLDQRLKAADERLDMVRMAGDAACAVFFHNEKPKARAEARGQLIGRLQKYIEEVDLEAGKEIEAGRDRLRFAEKPVVPFHWQIEFPEVFGLDEGLRPTRGFDAIAGNPPFAGKNTLIEGNAGNYLDWLKTLHPESHGNSDLVAHFFRRTFSLLRERGCFGLIATNTIGQGDTRFTGLRSIRKHGGTIYRAVKRLPWPGEAAVIVSVVHVCKGSISGPYVLQMREVPLITAYLFHRGGDENPATLAANADKSFQGSIVLGMGFTFDDTDKKQIASPLSRMRELIAADPRNQERIFPYLGGEEVNDDPEHKHHRYVINFEDFPLKREERSPTWADADVGCRKIYLQEGIVPCDYPGPVAADWPDLLAIVEERVKSERLEDNREVRRRFWWKYGERAPALYTKIRGMARVLAINCGATPHMSFAFAGSASVFANTLVVVADNRVGAFAVLQSSIHELWTRRETSSMKDDLRYAKEDCFETFPLPLGFEHNPALDAAGREYYEFRAALMVRNQQGLTKTYNRFHDPGEQSEDFRKLRALHHAMDRAVLDAYGWSDIQPIAQFEAEFDEEQSEEDEFSSARKPKKKYRLRWPEEVRDDVLARLLTLNEQRAAEEALEPKQAKPRKAKTLAAGQLFDTGDEP
ncbi:MAG TPA: DNA methyltransferase [Bryobacteraceae bacterium]